MKTRTLCLVGLLFVQSLGAASFKISELPEATSAVATNLALIVASTGETSKIAVGNLLTGAKGLDASGGLLQNDFSRTNIYLGNLTSGNIDVFTVPSGKRALIDRITVSTTNATAGVAYQAVKTNAVVHRLVSGSTLSTNLPAAITTPFVYEANETVVVNSSTDGANVFASIWVFENTIRLHTPRAYNPTTGNFNLYTVPAGYTAVGLIYGATANVITSSFANDSGATRVGTWYLVQSGASSSTTNRVSSVSAVDMPSGTHQSATYPSWMMSGDVIVFNTDASDSGQVVWVNVLEVSN